VGAQSQHSVLALSAAVQNRCMAPARAARAILLAVVRCVPAAIRQRSFQRENMCF
jgi:hypothetical protein